MQKVKTIALKKQILDDNGREADALRAALKSKGVFYLNLMSSPGSGKTTLIRILLALLSPQQGKATIYNNHHQETALTPLTRCNFAYVPQGNTLLSGTIRDNLRLGRLTATEEEMKEALFKMKS